MPYRRIATGPAADEHARRARIAATQLQLVAGARHGGEAERMRKRLGANQVRLLEFQPREIRERARGARRAEAGPEAATLAPTMPSDLIPPEYAGWWRITETGHLGEGRPRRPRARR